MMTIREYFADLYGYEDFEVASNVERELYELYEDEDERFYDFCREHDINLAAVEIVMGSTEYVLTLWAWDMCGE